MQYKLFLNDSSNSSFPFNFRLCIVSAFPEEKEHWDFGDVNSKRFST